MKRRARARALLADLERLGIEVTIEGGSIRCSPSDALGLAQERCLRGLAQDVLAILRRQDAESDPFTHEILDLFGGQVMAEDEPPFWEDAALLEGNADEFWDRAGTGGKSKGRGPRVRSVRLTPGSETEKRRRIEARMDLTLDGVPLEGLIVHRNRAGKIHVTVPPNHEPLRPGRKPTRFIDFAARREIEYAAAEQLEYLARPQPLLSDPGEPSADSSITPRVEDGDPE